MRPTTHARRIEVQIQNDERRLRLWVRNDGKGVDSGFYNQGSTGNWGLVGIDERAKLVGGQLEIWTQLDSGTEIELRIPASIAYLVSAAHQSRKRTAG